MELTTLLTVVLFKFKFIILIVASVSLYIIFKVYSKFRHIEQNFLRLKEENKAIKTHFQNAEKQMNHLVNIIDEMKDSNKS